MNSTQRFSDRVENYMRFRPHYPREVIEYLREHYRLDASQIVADIGSGTGISTTLFLANGNTCYAVEPNREMREAGEKLLGHFPNFRSVNGTAESTTLPAQSVDWIIAGQAFHWFDNAASRREFERILKPSGRLLLMWNQRNLEAEGIARDYNDLLIRYIENYEKLSHHRIDMSKSLCSNRVIQAFMIQTCDNRRPHCAKKAAISRLLNIAIRIIVAFHLNNSI